VPQQEHLYLSHSCCNPNIWTDLITKYPNSSTPSVAPVDENTAIVNEPFYADLLFKNLLGLDNPLDASFVDFQPLSDLKLLPREERQVSLELLCAVASQKLEITHVHYKFHSLIDCLQSLKKKGKRLQNTLSERLSRVYSFDRSMQVYVRTEIPILEIMGFENFDKEIYAGKSVFREIKIQNVGKVKMKNLQCVISHDSFFRICTPAELADQKRPTLYQTNCTPEDPLIIETSNHLVNDSPALLATELEIDGRTRSLVLCRGEKVGQHNIYWLFTFQLATTGEFLTFRHVQHLLVVPSLEVRPFIRPSVTKNAFYLLIVEIDNVGFPEDVEIQQVSTIGTHWSSNCLHFDPNSSHIVTLPAGSRSMKLWI
ncbi:hypothetical protein O181_103621, partial [Austropuccinia psidii MF-1]|nr:hypothetical protein [Austropuccinia psidii MF-1]